MKPPNTTRRTINLLDQDILCIIFSILDLFDLVRCSSVCKSWNVIINTSRLMHTLYVKQWANEASSSSLNMGGPLNVFLEDLAMQNHRSALVQGSVFVDQWKGHTVGIDQCRMKMGLILTGVGDKLMRLWSSTTYKCLEEYSLSDLGPLADFDFDENKVVGLAGTRLCIWMRHRNRSAFPLREGTFPKGLCMRYMDPDAMVGCQDGTVRVFDMYSSTCSQIIRMGDSGINCLAVGDDQLVLSGSSHGGIKLNVLGQSSNQRVSRLKPSDLQGVKTLCYNPSSHLAFAGSINGYAECWDLRKMKKLWGYRVGPNAIYSMQFLRMDMSTLVVGGLDGVLRILDQNTGEILSRCVIRSSAVKITSTNSLYGSVERKQVKRLTEDSGISNFPLMTRQPIRCIAVGMGKVVTTHNTDFIRMWRFRETK
ncbi:F-box/WD-40 repeat-containing protein At3g52030 isoform X1 [Amaranthus tricolor]|uniref:F-box/WD-40 repeat-containing protein At3g52030 isoform X1 n=2 Tax=Amaranthus tricolor TaxID=29722 RepID=UPI002586BA2C|nr:F-box/WD-40 repeat-containing protein At3g52030 isoform X1 [Amaranthus tricolor]